MNLGDVYGTLTITELDVRKNNRRMVRVRCACGRSFVVRKDHVRSGRTRRCKSCSGKDTADKFGGPPKPTKLSVGYLGRVYFNTIKNGAKRRGLEFSVTQEYLWDLFLEQGEKCALTGETITLNDKVNYPCGNPDYTTFSASLDRIESSKGYIKGNVQWVHREINRFKNNYTVCEFIRMCRAVAEHHKTRNERIV